MEVIQRQMVEAKCQFVNALKEVNWLCRDFNCTAGILKRLLGKSRKTK
jgi:hypothetical protein